MVLLCTITDKVPCMVLLFIIIQIKGEQTRNRARGKALTKEMCRGHALLLMADAIL